MKIETRNREKEVSKGEVEGDREKAREREEMVKGNRLKKGRSRRKRNGTEGKEHLARNNKSTVILLQLCCQIYLFAE